MLKIKMTKKMKTALGTTSEKKNGKKDDILQKGGGGLGKIHHF